MGESCTNYAQEVKLWSHVANLDPGTRASTLILNMDTVARQACMPAGSDEIMDQDGAMRVADLA